MESQSHPMPKEPTIKVTSMQHQRQEHARSNGAPHPSSSSYTFVEAFQTQPSQQDKRLQHQHQMQKLREENQNVLQRQERQQELLLREQQQHATFPPPAAAAAAPAGGGGGQYSQIQLLQMQRMQQQSNLQRIQQQQQQKPPPTKSRKVIDVRIITHSMENIIQNPSQEYKTLIQNLPKALAFVIRNCIAFKFELRDPIPTDPIPTTTGGDSEYSPDASYFLRRLASMGTPLHKRPLHLIGLRCACCYKENVSVNGSYVGGSTNFIDLTQPNVDTTLCTIIRSRKDHMTNCPAVGTYWSAALPIFVEDVPCLVYLCLYSTISSSPQKLPHFQPHLPENHIKGLLFSYKFTSFHKAVLGKLMKTWVSYAKNHYYTDLSFLGGKQPPIDAGTAALLRSLEVTEESLGDELTRSFESAYQMKGGDIMIDDLGGLFLTGTETPRMEDFLDIYQVRMKHKDHEFTLGFRCRHCQDYIGGGELNFKDLTILCKEIWEHAVNHCVSCNEIPRQNQCRFRSKTHHYQDGIATTASAAALEPPMEDLIEFFKALTRHLRHILRWTIPKVSPKLDFDAYRPLSIEMLKKYEPIACQVRHFPSPQSHVIPVQNLHMNDVIVGSEMHRELEGNRRFRRLISEHRPLYAKLSAEEQELVAETLSNLVKKQGGQFCTLDNAGAKYRLPREKCVEYVTRALKRGFPDMIRAPLDRNAVSKVQQISYAPQVGIMNQYIRWGFNTGSSSSSPRYKLSAFKERNGKDSGDDSQSMVASPSAERPSYDYIPNFDSFCSKNDSAAGFSDGAENNELIEESGTAVTTPTINSENSSAVANCSNSYGLNTTTGQQQQQSPGGEDLDPPLSSPSSCPNNNVSANTMVDKAMHSSKTNFDEKRKRSDDRDTLSSTDKVINLCDDDERPIKRARPADSGTSFSMANTVAEKNDLNDANHLDETSPCEGTTAAGGGPSTVFSAPGTGDTQNDGSTDLKKSAEVVLPPHGASTTNSGEYQSETQDSGNSHQEVILIDD